jgi:hypothetical protein
MVLLYWEIGKTILGRQEREGLGAKAIDRLSADLRTAYPDMQGLSPRNLKNMRTFAAAWPDEAIGQENIRPSDSLLLDAGHRKLEAEFEQTNPIQTQLYRIPRF